MILEEFDDVLRHDRRTRSEWTDREWTDHCIKVAKEEIDDETDREMIIKMINLGWNITVH